MKKNVIDDYTGSLSNYADDYVLEENVDPDSVEYFTMDKDVEAEMYDTEGNGPNDASVINEGCEDYLVFLGGDSSLMVSKNSDGNGKKIAVVKESYGNAFCTFMAYTYSEVHMIDLRYFENTGMDFKEYLEENGIDEVVVINNNMATATDMILECLEGLVS